MTDRDTTLYFVVKVPVFGDPLREEERIMLALARAIHHGVKPDAALAALGDGGFSDGRQHFSLPNSAAWVTLDPLGDDMGHHGDEHPAPLVLVENIEPT